MQFVLIVYHGTFPLPGSAAWEALPEAEQKSIYADYAEVNKAAASTLRLPPIAPGNATTVQVRGVRCRSRTDRTLLKESAELSCSMQKTSKQRLRWLRGFHRPAWVVR